MKIRRFRFFRRANFFDIEGVSQRGRDCDFDCIAGIEFIKFVGADFVFFAPYDEIVFCTDDFAVAVGLINLFVIFNFSFKRDFVIAAQIIGSFPDNPRVFNDQKSEQGSDYR